MDKTYKIGQTYYPRHPIAPSKQIEKNNQNNQFNEILNSKLETSQNKNLSFSVHAKQRLDSRGIQLNNEDISKLNNAVNKAEQKGVKDSLILMNDLAFVVNVPNKTVITTIDESSMKEHIFTNIDGAIIL